MGHNPHWIGARCGIVEICQGIGIGIEQIRCDIVEIATSEDSIVDHGECTLHVQRNELIYAHRMLILPPSLLIGLQNWDCFIVKLARCKTLHQSSTWLRWIWRLTKPD